MLPGRHWCAVLLVVLCSLLSLAAGQDDTIRYDSLDVLSTIEERFVTTRVSSVLSNVGNESQEVVFSFQLPQEGAFISKLTMSVGGAEYEGVARETQAAREEYQDRVTSGESAGLVESRGKELFEVSLSAGPWQQASFQLEYQQLLQRYQSRYRLELNVNPGRVVDRLNVTIAAKESQGIVPASVGKSDVIATEMTSSSSVRASYLPSRADQLDHSPSGLAQDLFLEYDVEHPSDQGAGLIVAKDGYFVHFFSPGGLPRLPVDVVFVIDVSGSMGGAKIAQARESLATVINQLDDGDRMGLVLFESSVSLWRPALEAVGANRGAALEFVAGLEALGGTNLNEGLLRGVSLLADAGGRVGRGRVLILLTDGQPTSGVTNSDAIVAGAVGAVGDSGVGVNCLGFGSNLDYRLLERLALNNNGVVRRIYSGSDAAQQLEGFYNQVTSPVLSSLLVRYGGSLEFSSALAFPFLFSGGEVVVVGKFLGGVTTGVVPVTVIAYGNSSELTFRGSVDTVATEGDFPVSRLVAIKRIQTLLASRLLEGANQTALEAEALRLALRHNLATELTSLVVVVARGGGNGSNHTGLVDPDHRPSPNFQDSNLATSPNLNRQWLPPSTTGLGSGSCATCCCGSAASAASAAWSGRGSVNAFKIVGMALLTVAIVIGLSLHSAI